MKLVSATINNYRSIKNAIIKFEEDVTVLAGKNEAGKTSILKALYDMNYNRSISDEVIPIDLEETNEKPEIEIELECDLNEIEKNSTLKEVLDLLKITPNNSKKYRFKVTKQYQKEYTIFAKTPENSKNWNEIGKNIEEKILKLIEQLKQQGLNIPDFDGKQMQQLIQNLNVELKKIGDNEIKQKILETIKSIQLFERFKREKPNIIQQILPNFILFESFKDPLPDKIHFAKALNNEIVKEFFIVIGKNKVLEQWTNYVQNPQKFHKITAKVKDLSTDIFKGFLEDYTDFELVIERGGRDNTEVWFLIKEPKKSNLYKISQRSEGLRWWLSLNIRIKAKTEKNKRNVLLIDEPSLYLHISAQKKAMKKIFEVSKEGDLQIIYATHSPYMLPAENLEKIRIVEKGNDGTKVKRAYESADKDALTPVLVAIGANILSGLSLDCELYPIIVEGITDYIYLSWAIGKVKSELISQFKENSEKVEDIISKIRIIPAGGADKSYNIGTILWYLGFRPFFIFDGDKKGRTVEQKIRNELKVEMEKEQLINTYCLNEKDSKIENIEDWFAPEIKKIIEEKEFDEVNMGKNKNNDIKKIDIAKKVTTEDSELSEESKKRTVRLFKKIIDWFMLQFCILPMVFSFLLPP